MYNPISFDECGHTLCELCMRKVDQGAWEAASTTTFPMFKCPECRTATLLTWDKRPKNKALHTLLSAIPGYSEACKESRDALARFDRSGADEEEAGSELLCSPAMSFAALSRAYAASSDPGDDGDLGDEGDGLQRSSRMPPFNVAKVSKQMQRQKIKRYLSRVVPIVCDSAANGMPSVSIQTRARDLYVFTQEIAESLFEMGIHSVSATPREFTIHITTPKDADWSSSYVNPNYSENA